MQSLAKQCNASTNRFHPPDGRFPATPPFPPSLARANRQKHKTHRAHIPHQAEKKKKSARGYKREHDSAATRTGRDDLLARKLARARAPLFSPPRAPRSSSSAQQQVRLSKTLYCRVRKKSASPPLRCAPGYSSLRRSLALLWHAARVVRTFISRGGSARLLHGRAMKAHRAAAVVVFSPRSPRGADLYLGLQQRVLHRAASPTLETRVRWRSPGNFWGSEARSRVFFWGVEDRGGHGLWLTFTRGVKLFRLGIFLSSLCFWIIAAWGLSVGGVEVDGDYY